MVELALRHPAQLTARVTSAHSLPAHCHSLAQVCVQPPQAIVCLSVSVKTAPLSEPRSVTSWR